MQLHQHFVNLSLKVPLCAPRHEDVCNMEAKLHALGTEWGTKMVTCWVSYSDVLHVPSGDSNRALTECMSGLIRFELVTCLFTLSVAASSVELCLFCCYGLLQWDMICQSRGYNKKVAKFGGGRLWRGYTFHANVFRGHNYSLWLCFQNIWKTDLSMFVPLIFGVRTVYLPITVQGFYIHQLHLPWEAGLNHWNLSVLDPQTGSVAATVPRRTLRRLWNEK